MFRSLYLNPLYTSYENDLIEEFYNPIFKYAVSFDRISAYFSGKTLAKYSSGLEYFAKNGNKYRLIISECISPEDYEQIKQGYTLKKDITDNLLEKLREELSLEEEKNISNLAYLISLDVVQIKIAFVKKGIFHDKCGIFYDKNNNIVCFRGSNNETVAAIDNNYETFQVTCSWLLDNQGFYERGLRQSISEFDKLWNNEHKNIIVLDAEEVVMKEILKHNKGELVFEDTLLQENCVILDYSKRLILRINTDDSKWILKSPFFKLKLRKYVDKMEDQCMYFKEFLTYIDFEKIHKLINDKAQGLGKRYFATKRLLDYIEGKNIYIHKRASLGIEIKRQDEKMIEKFKEYSKVVNENMTRKLREKQMWDSFFMFAMNRSGNFSVPGSGKTSSVLGVYAYLKSKSIVKRIVMIGPKNAFGSWIDEFNVCFDGKEELRVFNIHDKNYKNFAEKRRELIYNTGNCNLFLFNYECLGSYEKEILDLVDENTLLVFDEVHKVKRIDGDTPGKYAGHALEIAKKAQYTIAMTGTPIPNSYTDLYNLLHILYNDEYKEFFNFNISKLKNPNQDQVEEINNKIQPFFCRTTKEQLKVPSVNSDELIMVKGSKEEQRLFKIISDKYRQNKLALFIRLLQMESNPKMLLQSLDLSEFKNVLDIEEDIENIDYKDYSVEIENLVKNIDITTKKKACIELINKLVSEKKKVIIWCIFIDSIKDIQRLLEEQGIKTSCIYGEVELNDRLSIIDGYKNGKYDVLITNPHTLAESVSLHSICHDAIYFEYSYNLVHLLQSKDRIHRLGLPDSQYTQYYYMQSIFEYNNQPFSIDEQIYNRLCDKERIMLDAIDNNRLEEVTTSEEDLDFILEKLFN
ncbi:SNF2-related protein [Romboutsia ilealis]|uniref:SNF2-related protein n=1 Tax=Romboutsia ilealis TaxID=1115758 RepID=UPI002494D6CA|nr:SNF2-related protein [Romboutsia ilealis]